jgi:DDE family transposase
MPWRASSPACVLIWASAKWRLLLGSETTAWSQGGIAAVARASGVARTSVRVSVSEFASGVVSDGRTRRAGTPRPSVEQAQPGLTEALDMLVDSDTRGDPESPLRWTSKSLRSLVDALAGKGFTISEWTVARLLKAAGCRLQANSTTKEGGQHPDRDAQFRYWQSTPPHSWSPGSR